MTEEEIIKYIKDNYAVYDFNADNLELAVLMFKDGYEQGATDINVVATHTDNTEVILNLQKENEELKVMFEIVCKERYGYAWEWRKSDIIEKLKRRIENDR